MYGFCLEATLEDNLRLTAAEGLDWNWWWACTDMMEGEGRVEEEGMPIEIIYMEVGG